ncbi:MAG: efflux RND transporter permease subunit, partial [Sphingobium sp.]
MSFQVSAWSIRNPIPVVCLFIALTLAGIVAFAQLPIRRMPNVAFPLVSVTVTQNGAAPSEVENQITRPIENALSGVAGIKHITSTVTLGRSSTNVEFELRTDMQKSMDDVRTAVERARIILPAGIDPPTVQRFDVDSIPIITYAISSATMSRTQLSFFIDKVVAREIQARAGVAQVQRLGGAEREINVILDPERMAALGVTASQINSALLAFNTDDPGGRAGIGGVEQTIRVLGSGRSVDDIRDISF